MKLDLSEHFHNESYSNGEDQMSNINRKEAYTVIKSLAVAEAAKDEEEKNEGLAFYADAVDDV